MKIKESEKNEQTLESYKRAEKKTTTIEYKVDSVVGMLSKGLERRFGNWRSNEESISSRPQRCYDQLEYLEESWRPGELAIAQTSQKTHQLDLV